MEERGKTSKKVIAKPNQQSTLETIFGSKTMEERCQHLQDQAIVSLFQEDRHISAVSPKILFKDTKLSKYRKHSQCVDYKNCKKFIFLNLGA